MKKLKSFISTTVLVAVLMPTLVSCSSNTTSADSKTSDSVIEEFSSDYYMAVENYGRTLTLNQAPTKVLTLGPNCTELFVALGLGDKIVGRALANHSRGALPEYADEVNSIPEINHSAPTREAILTSGADFIYSIDWALSDSGLDVAEAEEYGMNVYVNAATSLEELYKEIEDIGKIFGVEENATNFINDQKARIQTVSDIVEVEKTKNGEPLKVLVYDSGNDGVFTASGSNFESTLISLAGGENIFNNITDKQWITVSYEEILKQNPDIIIVHDYDNLTVDEKIAEIKANPVLSELDCVKNNRFTSIDLESIFPGNRVANTVEHFAAAFYPESFK